MGYVDAEFYKKTYNGNSIPDDQLQRVLDRASLDVDVLTHRKIHKLGGIDKLSDFEQLHVKLAVCSQAEHSYTRESMKGVSSYSIGDVSVSVTGDQAFDKMYDKACVSYLTATNLMYRGL